MEKQQVIVRLKEDGEILVETKGIKGEECLAYIDILENVLEAQTTDSNYTHEYYETTTSQTIKQINLNMDGL